MYVITGILNKQLTPCWNKCCCVLFVLAVSLLSCRSQKVLFATQNITGVLEQSVVIEFKVNYTGLNATDPTTKSFIAETFETKQQELALGSQSSFIVVPNAPHKFAGRLEAEYDSAANSYKLTINNLKYTDDQKFEGVLTYSVDNNNEKSTTVVEWTSLTVLGGPTMCGPNLAARYNATAGGNLSIPLLLCGNQVPFVTIEFDGGPKTVVKNVTKIGDHEYLYHFELFNLKPSHCGKVLKYVASGYSADMTNQTIVDVYFTPEVNSLQSSREALCFTTTWDEIDTDDSNTLIAGLAGGIGGLILVILIIVIICVCCKQRGKMKNQLQMTSIHEYDDQSKAENGKGNKKKVENTNGAPPEGDKDVPEVVSAAQLKFYDPYEFDIKPSNGFPMMADKNSSPPQTPADPPPEVPITPAEELPPPRSMPPHVKTNKSYEKDEFDSDDDVPYENFDPKHGVNPTLARK